MLEVTPIKIETGYDGQLGTDWEESMQTAGREECTS